MDVHHERVGAPSALFLDDHGVHPIEVHGHGSSCAEGVTTDVLRGVSKVAFVESNGASALLNRTVDLKDGDILWLVSFGVADANASVHVAAIGHDVVDAAG